jgi:hypothetical protein
LYVVQNVSSIKGQMQSLGNFIKLRIENDNESFELAVGSNTFKINKYKKE